MEQQPPGEISAASSPLSRVHRRPTCKPHDAATVVSEGEPASDTRQKLQISLYNEVKDSEAHNTDGTKQEEPLPAGTSCDSPPSWSSTEISREAAASAVVLVSKGNVLNGLQDEFGSSPYQTLTLADCKDHGIDTVQHSDGDDISFSEFSQLRLQMKPVIQTQTKVISDEEVDLSDTLSSNMITNPTTEPRSVMFLMDYTDIGDQDRSLQERNRAYRESKSYSERKLKHHFHRRNALESQNTEISSCSLSEATRTDSDNKIAIPETSWYPHEVTADAKEAEAALQDGALTTIEALPSLRTRPVAETEPPRETILSPINIPQIVLELGPTVTYFAKRDSRVVKVEAQTQSSLKKSPSTSLSTESTSYQAPPPYSECVRHMASPTGMAKFQQSPKINRKARQPTRKPEVLLSLGRTNPNLYMHGAGTGYSQLHSSGTSLLDANISIYTRNKADGQVSLDGGRTAAFIDNEHQFLAFISCLFCWPIGLVAIYYSNMCQILKAEGNHAQAQVYGRQAFIVSTLAMCAGSLTYIIMLICRKMY